MLTSEYLFLGRKSMQGSCDTIVIGGSGFVGEFLCISLANKYKGVLNLDLRRSERLNGIGGIDQQEVDIAKEVHLESLLKRAKDLFILIGQVGPNFNAEQETKLLGKILNAADASSRVFYFSSALVYGESSRPKQESDECSPLDSYSQFKYMAEGMVRKRWKDTGCGGAIFRLANVYGSPRNRGFIGLVLNKIFGTQDGGVILNGDGSQSRDYILVDDVIEGVMAVAEGLQGQDTVNIATGKSRSLIDVVEAVSWAAKKRINYEISGQPTQEVHQSLVDNTKLILTYGFSPKFSLESGILKTLDRYKAPLSRAAFFAK